VQGALLCVLHQLEEPAKGNPLEDCQEAAVGGVEGRRWEGLLVLLAPAAEGVVAQAQARTAQLVIGQHHKYTGRRQGCKALC
jgi:hypothetical protein